MWIIIILLFCVTQLEFLVALGLLAAAGRLPERKTKAPPEPEEKLEDQEKREAFERNWRDTMDQLAAYSLDTARRAARGNIE